MDTAIQTPAVAVKLFPDKARIDEYLRAHGLAGPITRKFSDDRAWSLLGDCVAQALQETGAYPPGLEGARAYMDEMLSMTPEGVRELPFESPMRLVTVKAFELMNAKIDAAIFGHER